MEQNAEEQSVPLVQIRLFGPFEARVNGQPLPHLRSRRGQELLALLALRHARPVEREWLAGILWPDSADGLALLRRTLTDLRQALGPAGDRIEATRHTLRMRLSAAEADVVAFEDALALGDAGLEVVIQAYRGPLLEGNLTEWILPEREARAQVYLNALEARAAQQIGDNRNEAILRLRHVIALDPLRETAQRLLMQALAGSGDYAAAIQVYRSLRLYLHQTLQAEPDPETTALMQQLRAESRTRLQSAPPPPVSSSKALPSVSTRQLPCPLTSFVGREMETREIIACLETARLLTLTGPGGVGKTRLAIQVAEQMDAAYPDGVWFVDLATLTEPEHVPRAVAATMGVQEKAGTPLALLLAEQMLHHRALLLLDNCEHVATACARLLETLLLRCTRVCALATSRTALGLAGEIVWRVPSLSLPFEQASMTATVTEKIQTAADSEAVMLFVERAKEALPAFALSATNAPAILHICRRLDGIPLALEMAAARVRMLSLEQIVQRLADRFRLLTSGSMNALPRHQTLRAMMEWSYSLLTEKERILLRRLSVFSGGWTLEAAEAICADTRMEVDAVLVSSVPVSPVVFIEDWDVLDLLTALVDHSLVMVEQDIGGGRRYRLLETVRQFSTEQLRDATETESVAMRHRDWYQALAEQAEPYLSGAEQKTWLDRLEIEHDNLRAALKWSVEPERRLRLAGALWRFWFVRGHSGEGRSWLISALRKGPAEASELRAKAWNGAGALAQAQGDYASARTFYEEGLALRRALGNVQDIARSLNNLGNVAYLQSDYAAARALYEESVALRREQGDKQGIAAALGNLGVVLQDQGDGAAAYELFAQSLALARETGNRMVEANNLNNMGNAASDIGAYDVARTHHEEALALRQEMGDRAGIARSLHNLGTVSYYQRDYETARRLFEESLALRRAIGDRQGIAFSCNSLGNIARQQGDYITACALHTESLTILQAAGYQHGTLSVLEGFAALFASQKSVAKAARLYGAIEELRAKLGTPRTGGLQEHAEIVAGLRNTLGEEVFASAWEVGRILTTEEAVALVLEPTELS